ncbi:MAG: beta-galactosidase, partial [Lachnospiraceae bacterium]|nr:beta-galactosidase [Lachnospiraceae bacterium]
WIFLSYKGEHPATEEYVYQDYHNNDAECTDDFKPGYEPESRPYACCEMGGGMTCYYYYRFRFPYKSVDAMANIKIASGCNFWGYYMFQGGSNPVGKYGAFLNEGQTPKISYDYQAALGEFGQVRESYRRLKTIHYFVRQFGEKLCGLQTVLPAGASRIAPKDDRTLRYAVRTDGKRGFLFVNNYQDHFSLPDRHGEEITLQLESEERTWHLGIVGDENAILPFHFDMEGIDLVQANAQAVTRTVYGGEVTYVFFVPDGMTGEFQFEDEARVAETGMNVYTCAENMEAECFMAEKGADSCKVLVLSRSLVNNMFLLSDGRLIFTDEALLEDEKGIRLESTKSETLLHVYPADGLKGLKNVSRVETDSTELFGRYQIKIPEKKTDAVVEQVGPSRYTIQIQKDVLKDVKDLRLQLEYTGDIGTAFIDGRMIHDNFANGAVWEIGLKDFERELETACITVYIVPLKEGVNVNVESAMAARLEEAKSCTAELKHVRLQPVYEMEIC